MLVHSLSFAPPAAMGSAGEKLLLFASARPSSALSQGTPYPKEGEKHALIPILAAGLLFGSAAAFVGVRTGLAERGWISAAGWVSGVVGGAIGLFNLATLGLIGLKGNPSSRTAEL